MEALGVSKSRLSAFLRHCPRCPFAAACGHRLWVWHLHMAREICRPTCTVNIPTPPIGHETQHGAAESNDVWRYRTSAFEDSDLVQVLGHQVGWFPPIQYLSNSDILQSDELLDPPILDVHVLDLSVPVRVVIPRRTSSPCEWLATLVIPQHKSNDALCAAPRFDRMFFSHCTSTVCGPAETMTTTPVAVGENVDVLRRILEVKPDLETGLRLQSPTNSFQLRMARSCPDSTPSRSTGGRSCMTPYTWAELWWPVLRRHDFVQHVRLLVGCPWRSWRRYWSRSWSCSEARSLRAVLLGGLLQACSWFPWLRYTRFVRSPFWCRSTSQRSGLFWEFPAFRQIRNIIHIQSVHLVEIVLACLLLLLIIQLFAGYVVMFIGSSQEVPRWWVAWDRHSIGDPPHRCHPYRPTWSFLFFSAPWCLDGVAPSSHFQAPGRFTNSYPLSLDHHFSVDWTKCWRWWCRRWRWHCDDFPLMEVFLLFSQSEFSMVVLAKKWLWRPSAAFSRSCPKSTCWSCRGLSFGTPHDVRRGSSSSWRAVAPCSATSILLMYIRLGLAWSPAPGLLEYHHGFPHLDLHRRHELVVRALCTHGAPKSANDTFDTIVARVL